jgi:uncharacterized protein YceH (UPF0502 family)
MDLVLTPIEVRVLGCLIEKEATTPDQYPLSLNALTNACNQKTNREPVMSLNDTTVMQAVDSLVVKTMISTRGGGSSRVLKYSHRMSGRLFNENSFSKSELAVLAVLFLRGPQTLGEIRTRCGRIHEFADLAELSNTVKKLADRDDGPFVTQLAKQAGRKEARYAHLFAGEVDEQVPIGSETTEIVVDDQAARIEELEIRLSQLAAEHGALKAEFEQFVKQFS